MYSINNSKYNSLQNSGLIIPSQIPVAEIVLWHRLLKDGKMDGFHFERLQTADVATFRCLNTNLTIVLNKNEKVGQSESDFKINPDNHVLELNHKRVLYNLEWVRSEIRGILTGLTGAIAS